VNEITAALATRGYYEVSEGSLDDGDLITAFMAALEQLRPDRAAAIKDDPEYTWMFARLSEDGTLGRLDDEDQADIDYFLWEYLWTELANAAPADCVFTQSEGNGSLFWFIKEGLVDHD
jgi:hypothetical protein